MYEYSITFVHCQLYILLLIKCKCVFFFLFLFLFATFRGEIKISKICQIAENSDRPRTERPFCNIVLKFQVDHACFQAGEDSANLLGK